MALLDGTADLPTITFSRFSRPEYQTVRSRKNVLNDLAEYIRSATLADVAHDAAGSAWGMLAPIWLQRHQRIKLLEKMMNEVIRLCPRHREMAG